MRNPLVKWLSQPLHFALLMGACIPILLTCLYVKTYTSTAFTGDDWSGSATLAVKAHYGILEWSDMLVIHGGHWNMFLHSSTILLTKVADFPIEMQNVLALVITVCNWLLLVYFFGREYPQHIHLVLVPFALLVFAIQQGLNWTTGIWTSYTHVIFFVLLAVQAMTNKPGWFAVLASSLFAIFAILTRGTGAAILASIPVMMWLSGYRKITYYLYWATVAGLVIFTYFFYVQEAAKVSTHVWDQPASPNPLTNIRYILTYLGAPFSTYQLGWAAALGLAGIISFIVNWLYAAPIGHRKLAVWTTFAVFALMAGVFISLGRGNNQFGLYGALAPRYHVHSMFLWISLLVLMIINGCVVPVRKWHIPLTYANVLLLMVALAGYVIANATYLQEIALVHDTRMQGERGYIEAYEQCILDFPLQRPHPENCLMNYGHADLERIASVAAAGLTNFRHETPVNILPETYGQDSPVILNTYNLWLNVYLRDWLLDGVDSRTIFHIGLPPRDVSVARIPDPIREAHAILDEATLRDLQAFVQGAGEIWYITIPEKSTDDPLVFALMESLGYAATPYPIQNPKYRDAKLSIFRFQQPPTSLETSLYFGEEKISLQAWTLFAEEPITPCENIVLQSWWTSETVPQFNYGTTLVLQAPDGRFIAQKDAAIAETLLQLWEPGKLYLDERRLTIPCDALPGEHPLLLGTYLQTDTGFVGLPAYDAAGNPLGERPVLTTIQITAP